MSLKVNTVKCFRFLAHFLQIFCFILANLLSNNCFSLTSCYKCATLIKLLAMFLRIVIANLSWQQKSAMLAASCLYITKTNIFSANEIVRCKFATSLHTNNHLQNYDLRDRWGKQMHLLKLHGPIFLANVANKNESFYYVYILNCYRYVWIDSCIK